MKILSAFLILFLLAFIYARYVEPGMVVLKTIEIHNNTFAGILGDKTVIHISDLHLRDGSNPLLDQVGKKVRELNPDLIFLTGDYVEWFSGEQAYRQAQVFLNNLSAKYGVFAVMGDADYTLPRSSCTFCHVSYCDQSPSFFAHLFLKNENRILNINDALLNVAGVDTMPAFDPSRYEINGLTAGMPTIFLSHTSLPFEHLSGANPVVLLCGDTHGGQVYLPLWIWKKTHRKPDPQHMYGYFREKNKYLVVSNGVGTSQLDIRFGRPPEIVLLRFLPEENAQ